VSRDLHSSKASHFITQSVTEWIEESRRDHSIVREVDSFFDVTTETIRVQDHS